MARGDPNASKTVSLLRRRVEDLEEGNNNLQERVEELDQTCKDLQLAKELLSQERDEWKSKAEELTYGEDAEAKLFYFEHKLANVTKDLANLEEVNQVLQSRLTKEKDAHLQMDAALSVHLEDLKETKERIVELTKELDMALEENEQLTSEVESLLSKASGAVPFIKPTDIWKSPEPLSSPNHQELELWLTQMEVYLEKVPIGGDLYAFLVTKLKGVALAHVISTVKAMRNEADFVESFETYKKILTSRFGDSNPTLNARRKLHALSFNGGKYREYVTDTKKLHGHLVDHPMSEEDKIFLHLEGIKVKELRDRLEFNPATLEPWKTLEELMTFALPKFGDLVYKGNGGGGAPKNGNGKGGGNGGSPQHPKRENGRQDNSFGFVKKPKLDGSKTPGKGNREKDKGKDHYGCKLSLNARKWYKDNGRCYRCGETHKVSECTANSKKLASDLPSNLKEGCSC